MTTEAGITKGPKGLGFFEKYLSIWVIFCILVGIILGKAAPGVAKYLDSLAIYVGEAPVVCHCHLNNALRPFVGGSTGNCCGSAD